MTALEGEQRLPRGLRIYFGFVLALLAAFALTAPWRIGGRDVGRMSVALWTALDLAAAALLVPDWRRAVRHLLETEIRISRRTLQLLAVLSFLFFSRFVLSLWQALEVNAADFSVCFDRPIVETLRGRILFCEFGLPACSLLGIHAAWIVLGFVPLYAIAASPVWLLLAQAAAPAAATAVGFLLFRRLLEDDLAALFVAAAFALNSYTGKTVRYVFHPEVFYPLALFLLLYGYVDRRRSPLLAGILLAISIKEDALLPLSGFALAVLAFDRRWRTAALAAFAGLAAYLLASLVVLPHFFGSPPAEPWYSSYWLSYGPTPPRAALGMGAHPLRLASDVAHSGAHDVFESLLYLPLLGSSWLIAALPTLIPYAASNRDALAQFSLYYSAPILPFLCAAAAQGIRRLEGLRSAGLSEPQRRQRRRLLAFALCACSTLNGASYSFHRPHPARREIAPLLDALGQRPVRIQGSLFPRAGYATFRRLLGLEPPAPTEAILLAPGTTSYPYTREELSALIIHLSADPRYRRTETPGGLLLFTPSPPSGRSPESTQVQRGRVAA